jgi:CubicO group peptidase (beta-lactamase class C family)
MSRTPLEINGFCSPEFYSVRDQFYKNFKAGKEVGAGLNIRVDGETAVDLWGGWTSGSKDQTWQEDSLTTIFSCTKALSAICALRLVDQGKLALDTPVSEYWPNFAAKGKERITLRHILGHRAGLPAVRPFMPYEALMDPSVIERFLERARPWWEPNHDHGYHAISFGWLVGKLIQVASGKTMGQYFDDEIAQPLGLDIHIGLDSADHARLGKPVYSRALLTPHRDVPALVKGLLQDGLEAMTAKAFINPLSLGLHASVNSRTWSRVEQPAANGMATANALGQLYGILAQGGTSDSGYQLLSADTLPLCWEPLSDGLDRVLKRHTRFSHGFMLPQQGDPLASLGPGRNSFGHNGLGGTLTFADPEHKIGFAYVTNRLGNYILVDPRPKAYFEAFYKAL